MDAVIVANYFHEHAPFAIKALQAGKHVMSECTSAKTLAECVALARAVEKTGKIYMLAENYPFTAYNLEMAALYKKKTIGDALYAEGEYNHPMSAEELLRISPGWHHWRLWLPATYYCTHALAPLMVITDRMPKSVNALAFPHQKFMKKSVRFNDPGAVILVKNDDGSVFRLFGIFTPGHSIWYRVHGTRGSMENVRSEGYWGNQQVRIVHEHYDVQSGEQKEMVYKPDFPAWARKLAAAAGHGGGDFFTNYFFAAAIRSGKQPYLTVYRGTAMSAVAIQSWRSALHNGNSYEIPDFSNEAQRKKYEHDNWSPFYNDKKNGYPPSSVLGDIAWDAGMRKQAKAIWKKTGYSPK
jgi:predicted dehydrogenase